MPQLGSDKVQVTFRDVTAYFSEEEWKILHEWQKELYRSVMKEIHQALILLGHQIINSNALIRLKGDGLFFRDHPDSQQTEMKAPNTSCYLDGQPDMLLEIIQEEPCCRDSYGAKETKIGDNASKGYPAMNLNTLVSIKREENCPQYTEGRESTDSLGTVSICIKEEGESVSMGHLHSEGRDVIHSPTVTDGSIVTSLFSPSVNKDQGIHFKEEPKPEETDTVDGDLHRNRIDVQKDRKMPPCTASLGEVVVNVLQSTDIRTTSTSQMLAESNLEPREVNMDNCESNIIIPTHGDFDQGPSKREKIHSYNECNVNIRSPNLCTGQPNIDQNGSRLTCPECEQSFSQRQSLTRHQRTHTNEKPYKCCECEEAYTNRKHLIQHQRQHMWDIVYTCNDCGQSFGQKGSLAKHQRTHSGVKLYSCTECEKSFCRREGLSKHKNIHMVDCAYKCSDCEKSFIWKESLIRHQRTHSGEKLFQCTECEKSFAYSHYLTIHKRKHTGERPYKCSECELSFSQKIVLIRHRRTHTGERPYQCTQCERSFSQKGNLAKHQITHSGEKPFNCSICDLNFSLKESLTRHQRNAH